MAPESGSDLRLEIGHVLFIDLVGYSKLLIEQQKARLDRLTEAVLATPQVRESPNEQLVRLPTGDGMALVFRNSSEEPARCALVLADAHHMAAEPSSTKFEIGHVLFIDLVGYSKLLLAEQKERLRELTDIVLATAQAVKAKEGATR